MSPRYVAIGSSVAAGPGIKPRAPSAPLLAGRSAVNYPHLVAARLGYDLVDVTYSGATTANVLTDAQNGAPPQVEALDGSEALVTVTIGGNDVGYVPMLLAAGLPRLVRALPAVGRAIRAQTDPEAKELALAQAADSLKAVGREVRARAPKARVLFVDYLTLLPPQGTPARPLPDPDAALGRHVGGTLEGLTAVAAAETGCELVLWSDASREHHPWSNDPWAVGLGLPWPWRPAPMHPNAAGMRAAANLIVERLS
ncbi:MULTISPECIES: SGNH/GDSL hydrolase family protein [unclassified Mycobacterium]|uniref:SGNH/GDSL hydrolase family protein n=1 Tax=unclassified Mycobacterium TaxID=2642494 RepID=UPI0029C96267|nr:MULTISPECIES: SGNH/GDSL hydrolase family protein [unclassified Mycobacterium]